MIPFNLFLGALLALGVFEHLNTGATWWWFVLALTIVIAVNIDSIIIKEW